MSRNWKWLVINLFLLLICLPSIGQEPVYTSWDNYTVANGMPEEKVLCVAADGDRVWAGTRKGVVLIEKGRIIKVFTPADGLASSVVTGIAVDKNTGDVWMATLGGLSRYSGGEFKNYSSLASGLANDVVYSVAIQKQYVWAATAAGISRFNTQTGEWSIYGDDYLPGHASSAGSIAVTKDKIYFGLWGGGVLEYVIAKESWKLYREANAPNQVRAPQGEGGPLSSFITGVSHDGHTLWASSRFGLSSYDGRLWRHPVSLTRGLGFAAVNMVRSGADGTWLCSNHGLVLLAHTSHASVLYHVDQESHGRIAIRRLSAKVAEFKTMTALASNEVFDVAFDRQGLWVATALGLSHGTGACRTQTCVLRQSLPSSNGTADAPPPSQPDRHAESAHTTVGDAVNIGFFGPVGNGPESIHGTAMLQGAELAIEEANAAGGFAVSSESRKPFALKVHDDSPVWGASTTEIVRMVNDEHVVAVLGTVDGASSHTMLKVASILEVAIVNSGTGDPDITATGLSWIVHNFPDDRAQAHALAHYAVDDLGLKRIGVVAMRERDAMSGVREFSREARRLGATEVLDVGFDKGEKDFSDQLKQLAQARVDVVLLWANPADAALALKDMRVAGMRQPVLGPNRLADPTLIQTAGSTAEGLVVTSAIDPMSTNPAWQAFQKNYRRRFNTAPDQYAAYAYDGARLVIDAARKAGLNRKGIRDVLREYANGAYTGVSGSVRFDANLNNISPPPMARVEGGKFVYWQRQGGIANTFHNDSH